ncbi:MAG: hypothetical protein L3J32_06770 [Rhizobiaceae bacterium]|nr:hypothetical protein [Rhizobiaceae bacterium]
MNGNKLFGRSLVVGGTGMLESATRFVACNSSQTTIGSRNPDKLAKEIGAHGLKLDWLAPNDQTIAALSKLPEFDLLISWIHDEAIWIVEHLENRLNDKGRSIRIHGCASRDPEILIKRNAPGSSQISRQTIILGWVNDPQGQRWLLDEEISTAVIEGVKHPRRKQITAGTVEGVLSLEL